MYCERSNIESSLRKLIYTILILVIQSLIVVEVISDRKWIEFVCRPLDIMIALRKNDHNNLIYEIHSEKLRFCVCAFVFVSEKFLHCGIKNIMSIDERFAEMALAIQQLTHTVTRLEMNQQERGIPIHNHERNTEDKTLRIDVSDFGGITHNPDDYLEWEARLDWYVEFKETSEEKQYKLAKIKLTKLAAIWLEGVQKQRRRENRERLTPGLS